MEPVEPRMANFFTRVIVSEVLSQKMGHPMGGTVRYAARLPLLSWRSHFLGALQGYASTKASHTVSAASSWRRLG